MRKVYVDTGKSTEKKQYNELLIESTFVQLYVSAHEVIYRLKFQCSLYLWVWVVSEMDEFNQIMLNKSSRSEFLSTMNAKGKKYSDSSVKSAIKDLIRAEILISTNDTNKRESNYMVNPKYFWKMRQQKDRTDAILAFINNIKIKKDEGNSIRSGSETPDAAGSGEAK